MKHRGSDFLLKGMTHAAEIGGDVLLKYFGTKLRIREKPDAGLVSKADLESEKAIVKKLRQVCPDFGFLTEEGAPNAAPCQGRWIIDPLDGTTNYLHGFPMFSISIAAEWEGQIIAGVIYSPVLKNVYSAAKGKGAFLNGRRIRVSKIKTLRESLLTTGFTYQKGRWLPLEIRAFHSMSAMTGAIRRPGSAALDLAFTASGVFEGFWERKLSPWDVAAGSLLVQEAGGTVTGFGGRPFSIYDEGILATNGLVHSAMLKIIKKA